MGYRSGPSCPVNTDTCDTHRNCSPPRRPFHFILFHFLVNLFQNNGVVFLGSLSFTAGPCHHWTPTIVHLWLATCATIITANLWDAFKPIFSRRKGRQKVTHVFRIGAVIFADVTAIRFAHTRKAAPIQNLFISQLFQIRLYLLLLSLVSSKWVSQRNFSNIFFIILS